MVGFFWGFFLTLAVYCVNSMNGETPLTLPGRSRAATQPEDTPNAGKALMTSLLSPGAA